MSLPEKVTTDESSPAAPWLAPPDYYDPVIEAYKKDVDRTLAGQFSAADCLTAPLTRFRLCHQLGDSQMSCRGRWACAYARLLAVACCVALCSSGCGDSSGPKLVPVVGKVTVDGQPVKAGTLSFRPDKSKGNMSPHEPGGEIDSAGNYKLFTSRKEGAPVGWYRVAVMAGEPVDVGNLSGQARWFANPKFASADTSGLSVEVVEKPADGAYDFKLTK